jgi:hypothetical protein
MGIMGMQMRHIRSGDDNPNVVNYEQTR